MAEARCARCAVTTPETARTTPTPSVGTRPPTQSWRAQATEQEASRERDDPHFLAAAGRQPALGPRAVPALAADFAQVKGAASQATAQSSAKALAEWLVSRNVLSKYQATILLAGRAGPFQYGEYKVYDRVDKGRLAGLFRAVHGPTGHPVLLHVRQRARLDRSESMGGRGGEYLGSLARSSRRTSQRWFEPVDAQVYKFVVSEDLRGVTVEERMTGKRFPPAEACRIARQAALGLAQLHQAGRIHGDVRPANLLLESIPGQATNAKLLWNAHEWPGPWNLAENPPGTATGCSGRFSRAELATPGYPPDALADLYALGCTLYTMLAGAPPFAGGSIAEKMARHAAEAIRPLEQLGVPQPLAQLVAYLMAKNPAVRYQAAALVAEQLAVFVEPAALYAQAAPAAPTLVGYEAQLRQRRPQSPLPTPAHSYAPAPVETASGFPVLSPRKKIVFGVDTFGPTPDAAGQPTPAIDPAVFHAPPSNRPAFAPAAATPIAPASAVPPFSLDTSAPSPASPSPIGPVNTSAAIAKRSARRRRQQLITAAGVIIACIGVAIGSVVVLMNSDLFKKPGGTQVAVADPDNASGEESAGKEPEGSGDSGQPAVTPASTGASSAATAGSTGANTANSAPGTPNTAVVPAAQGDGGFQQQIVPDDSKLLWAAPTTGRPISERLIPPDPQVFVFARPADLVASGEGQKVLQALGPAFAAQRSAWEKAAGFSMPEIEQLLVTLHPNEAKFPRACFVVRTKAELPPDQLLTRWAGPIPTQEGMATYYLGGGWAYYICQAQSDPRTFVMGDPRDVKEVVKAAGNPPPLGVPVRRLLKTTDSLRHVTIVANPQFFANDDGEPLFAAERAKVRQPLAWLLGDGVQAAAVSVHFGPEFYFEMRMLGSLDKEPFLLSSEVKSRLSQVPGEIENYLVGLTPPPYWKKLSFRYPEMVRQFHEQLRIGVENDQAVINAVLPGVAAHNLVLGGELLVSSAPGSGAAVVATATPTPTTVAAQDARRGFATEDDVHLRTAIAGVCHARPGARCDRSAQGFGRRVCDQNHRRRPGKEQHHAQPIDPRFRPERPDPGRHPDGTRAQGQSRSVGQRPERSGANAHLGHRSRSGRRRQAVDPHHNPRGRRNKKIRVAAGVPIEERSYEEGEVRIRQLSVVSCHWPVGELRVPFLLITDH